MNTRFICTTKYWFGGGIDLTPTIIYDEDSAHLHSLLKTTCDRHNPEYYEKFKAECDKYFFIKHRNEPRGVGGIFYDYLDGQNWEEDFAFTKSVGRTFLNIYAPIVRRRMHQPWSDAEKELQLKKRGRYAEFNLVYDRGTKFGLMTGGNIEAIFMSLPPVAKW
jgi:coproporphyrinogen III oxidase